MKISPHKIAKDLKIAPDIITGIITGQQAISADISLCLARYFNRSPQLWLGLQMDYDLDLVEDAIGEQIKQEVICYVC